jgi:hypothetical protein
MTKAALEMVIPAGEPIIEYRRFLAAPSELVFQAFTDPEHLAHWRGPEELQMVSCDIDLRVGGRYRYVHRGPDGQDHVGGTMMTSSSVLPSLKARDRYIAPGAERGLEESYCRLAQLLNSLIGVGQVA